MNYQQDLSTQEENKLARRGGCIAVILIPIILLCLLCTILSFTSNGRVLVSKFMLNGTYNGNWVGFVGFSDIAQSSCDLDYERPRPKTFEDDQAALETQYFINLRLYRKYWSELKNNEGNTGLYTHPSRIPQTFQNAKHLYCQR